MRQNWRWFGPGDTVSVDDMPQAGVRHQEMDDVRKRQLAGNVVCGLAEPRGVVTALEHTRPGLAA